MILLTELNRNENQNINETFYEYDKYSREMTIRYIYIPILLCLPVTWRTKTVQLNRNSYWVIGEGNGGWVFWGWLNSRQTVVN